MSTTPHILVVEDEEHLAFGLRFNLEAEGFRVTTVGDGLAALDVLGQADDPIELVVLDLMLPGMSGYEVCEKLRQRGSSIPVLMLSARSLSEDRIRGFGVGADQYLCKPFELPELLARIKALLRRSRLPSLGSQASGPLVVDPNARRVLLEGEPVDLTPREYDLLKTLALAPGKNFTREELLDRVWGPEYLGDARRVDLYISKIRAKLSRPGKPAPIRSIWGVGYRFES